MELVNEIYNLDENVIELIDSNDGYFHINLIETIDLFLMANKVYSPVANFMDYEDWRSVSSKMKLKNKHFFPFPITLSTNINLLEYIKPLDTIKIYSDFVGDVIAEMRVEEMYKANKSFETRNVFHTTELEHPGVMDLLRKGTYYVSGTLMNVDLGKIQKKFGFEFQTPDQIKQKIAKMGWESVVAMTVKSPMFSTQEYIARVALEVSDGMLVNVLLNFDEDKEYPNEVLVESIKLLFENYFPKDRFLLNFLPYHNRYAGPREALLHGIMFQNYGCDRIIICPDYAGIGNYYESCESQNIFEKVGKSNLSIRPLKIDRIFFSEKVGCFASDKTCPIGTKDKTYFINAATVKKMILEKKDVPIFYGRPEVLKLLRDYIK